MVLFHHEIYLWIYRKDSIFDVLFATLHETQFSSLEVYKYSVPAGTPIMLII
jgi:hypothetical protein